jgi:hypothetical protein
MVPYYIKRAALVAASIFSVLMLLATLMKSTRDMADAAEAFETDCDVLGGFVMKISGRDLCISKSVILGEKK